MEVKISKLGGQNHLNGMYWDKEDKCSLLLMMPGLAARGREKKPGPKELQIEREEKGLKESLREGTKSEQLQSKGRLGLQTVSLSLALSLSGLSLSHRAYLILLSAESYGSSCCQN